MKEKHRGEMLKSNTMKGIERKKEFKEKRFRLWAPKTIRKF